MKIQIKYVLFCFVMVISIYSFAQNQTITLQTNGEPLDLVLEEISAKNKLKFAFDSDLFETIETHFDLKNSTVNNFLNELKLRYFIHSKLIDGTWVLVFVEPQITAPESPESIVDEIQPVKFQTISGFIKDKRTAENLLYCNVAFSENRGCMTNDLGFFSFETEETDSVKLMISHLGYKRLDTVISSTQTAVIWLDPADILMEAIEIKRFEKQILQAAPQPEKIGFNPLKANNTPKISSDDLLNALLYIPGIDFISGGTPGISIRGGDPNDNLILFDGIPVLETSHLLGNMSVLNSKFVQQTFVSRGGFDAEFGERTAGLIELTGKSGKNNNPYLDLSANLLNTNVLINVPITDKFSVTSAWRKSYIDKWQNYLYLKLVDNENNGELESSVNPTLKYQDVNAKISFHPSNQMEFNVNILYGDDFQNRDYSLFESEDFYRNEWVESKSLGASFNWNWQINSNWYSSISAAYSTLEKQIENETGELQEVTEIIENPGKGKGKGKGLLKTKEKTYSRLVSDIDNGQNEIEEIRANWKIEFNKSIFKNQAGVGWSANSFQYQFFAQRPNAFIQVDSINNDALNYYLNAFLQQRIQPAPKFGLRWGVRANMDLFTSKIYWQPRAGIEFKPLNEWSLFMSGGIYYQFLSNIKRTDIEGHYNTVWFLPDYNDDNVIKSEHFIVGTKYDKQGWFINLEAYLKNTCGKKSLFAEIDPGGPVPSIFYAVKESNQKNQGIDFFLQKKHGIFNHMLSYNVSKSDEKMEDVFDSEWFPAYNDRLHRLKISELLAYKSWSLIGSWNFASGLPILNIMDNNSTKEIQRSSYFSQLDFTLMKKFISKHLVADIGISLLNVSDRKNIVEVDYLRFSSQNTSLTVRSDVSALSFTPVFFVNVKVQ